MGGDAKYKDGLSGNTYTYVNTGYKEENLNLRVDYDFDPTHSLRAAFNHMQSDADYPLTAPITNTSMLRIGIASKTITFIMINTAI